MLKKLICRTNLVVVNLIRNWIVVIIEKKSDHTRIFQKSLLSNGSSNIPVLAQTYLLYNLYFCRDPST